MGKAQLMAHVDTRRVSEDIVRSAPQPEFTDTWKPYSHGAVLDSMQAAVEELGLTIVDKQYSITKSLTRLFGCWEVGNGTNAEENFAIGFRTSTDKHFSFGECAGKRVFVCDNLVFAGEFKLFRKHTGGLSEDELMLITLETLKLVMSQYEELNTWHHSLKHDHLTDQQASLLLVAAMRQGIVAPSNFKAFQELYFDIGTKYTQTLYGWHGAATEVIKDRSLLSIQYTNGQLNDFIKHQAPRLLQEGVDYWDFGEVQREAQEDADEERKEAAEASRKDSSKLKRDVKKKLKAKEKEAENTTH